MTPKKGKMVISILILSLSLLLTPLLSLSLALRSPVCFFVCFDESTSPIPESKSRIKARHLA